MSGADEESAHYAREHGAAIRAAYNRVASDTDDALVRRSEELASLFRALFDKESFTSGGWHALRRLRELTIIEGDVPK